MFKFHYIKLSITETSLFIPGIIVIIILILKVNTFWPIFWNVWLFHTILNNYKKSKYKIYWTYSYATDEYSQR